MKKLSLLLMAVLLLMATAAMASNVMDEAKATFTPIPSQAPAIKGNPATPEKLELGKMLFFEPRLSKSGLVSCNFCHNVGMGGDDYFPFGVSERPSAEIIAGDKGRFKVTKTESDEYVFKSPSLRNIELTPPYFHSGKVWSLREDVRVMGTAQLDAKLNEKEMGCQFSSFNRLKAFIGK